MKKQRWRFTKWNWNICHKQCEECGGYGLSGQLIGNMHISFTCKSCNGEGFIEV